MPLHRLHVFSSLLVAAMVMAIDCDIVTATAEGISEDGENTRTEMLGPISNHTTSTQYAANPFTTTVRDETLSVTNPYTANTDLLTSGVPTSTGRTGNTVTARPPDPTDHNPTTTTVTQLTLTTTSYNGTTWKTTTGPANNEATSVTTIGPTNNETMSTAITGQINNYVTSISSTSQTNNDMLTTTGPENNVTISMTTIDAMTTTDPNKKTTMMITRLTNNGTTLIATTSLMNSDTTSITTTSLNNDDTTPSTTISPTNTITSMISSSTSKTTTSMTTTSLTNTDTTFMTTTSLTNNDTTLLMTIDPTNNTTFMTTAGPTNTETTSMTTNGPTDETILMTSTSLTDTDATLMTTGITTSSTTISSTPALTFNGTTAAWTNTKPIIDTTTWTATQSDNGTTTATPTSPAEMSTIVTTASAASSTGTSGETTHKPTDGLTSANKATQSPPGPTKGPIIVCPMEQCPLESVCLNGTCQCLSGSFLVGDRCIRAQVFPGQLHLISLTFTEEMLDRSSKAFQDTAADMSASLSGAFAGQQGYIRSDLVQLAPGSVIATINNIFNNTAASQEVIDQVIKDAIGNSSQGLLVNATFSGTKLCDQIPLPCDAATTMCTSANGRVGCSCKAGYISTVYSNTSCKACPSGQKVVGNSCQKCAFGYAGFNCADSSLLAVVVVSCVLGGVLLILILALLSYCCWRRCSGSQTQQSDASPYPVGELTKPWPVGITPIPRATTAATWDAAPTMEMMGKRHHGNGVSGSYDLNPDGMKTFTSKNPSRYSYLVQGHENPYFLPGDEKKN
ncbi:uncharacterized protein LOC144044775 isoform X2 [Vanacampus margaritifer]